MIININDNLALHSQWYAIANYHALIAFDLSRAPEGGTRKISSCKSHLFKQDT